MCRSHSLIGVTGGCEVPDLGAGNRARILCKSGPVP